MYFPQFHGLPIMTLPRLSSLVAAAVLSLTLSSCLVLSTAPQPADFKLSEAALSQKFPATRRTGAVRLYAQKIDTTRDQWGRETHQATGGALLVKDTTPPILAEAPSITVTPDYSEALGRSTVQKDDRLYIGQTDTASIRIDGSEIIREGPIRTRALAPDAPPPSASATTPELATATAPAPAPAETAAPQLTLPPTQPAPSEDKPKTVAQTKPKSKSTSRPKKTSPAKPRPSAAKPAAPNPPAAPAPDKALLNLLREPTER